MPINIAWGPVAIPANQETFSPASGIAATDTWLQVTADFSAMPAGVTRTAKIQYRKSAIDPWQDYGAAGGVTAGGVDHDRLGNVTEWGVRAQPLPDAGLAGRQVRASILISQAATLSGHAASG